MSFKDRFKGRMRYATRERKIKGEDRKERLSHSGRKICEQDEQPKYSTSFEELKQQFHSHFDENISEIESNYSERLHFPSQISDCTYEQKNNYFRTYPYPSNKQQKQQKKQQRQQKQQKTQPKQQQNQSYLHHHRDENCNYPANNILKRTNLNTLQNHDRIMKKPTTNDLIKELQKPNYGKKSNSTPIAHHHHQHQKQNHHHHQQQHHYQKHQLHHNHNHNRHHHQQQQREDNHHHRQNTHPQKKYSPIYSLNDYKHLAKNIELGTLGWKESSETKEKKRKRERMKQYAQKTHQNNLKKIYRKKSCQNTERNRSSREKGKEFAESLPKTQIKKSNKKKQDSYPNERDNFSIQDPYLTARMNDFMSDIAAPHSDIKE